MNRFVLLSTLFLSSVVHSSAFAVGFEKGQAKADKAQSLSIQRTLRGNLKTAYSLRLSDPRAAKALAGEVVSLNLKGDLDHPVAPPRLLNQARKIIEIAQAEERVAEMERALKEDRSETRVYQAGLYLPGMRLIAQMDRGQRARFKVAATDTVLRYNRALLGTAKAWLANPGLASPYPRDIVGEYRRRLAEGAGYKLPFEPQMRGSAKDKITSLRAQREEMKQIYDQITSKAIELNLL
jgi:hypothetical protein